MKKGERRELFERVIDLAEAVRSRGLDPFDVGVKEFFKKLRELLPELKNYDELYLDAEAILSLSEVVLHQEEWVKHRSSALYLDPLLITLKVHALEPNELIEIFLKSWHPIVEKETISPDGLRTALDYWTELLPLSERGGDLGVVERELERLNRSELKRRGIVSEDDFEKLLKKAWVELKKKAGAQGFISYWDFIFSKSFQKTIERAWLLSFLVSYGYASFEIKPLEEQVLVYPAETPSHHEGNVKSVPISITQKWWRERIERRSG